MYEYVRKASIKVQSTVTPALNALDKQLIKVEQTIEQGSTKYGNTLYQGASKTINVLDQKLIQVEDKIGAQIEQKLLQKKTTQQDIFTKIDSESEIIRDSKSSVTDKIVSIIGAEDSESEEDEGNVKYSGDQHFEIGVNNDDDMQISIA